MSRSSSSSVPTREEKAPPLPSPHPPRALSAAPTLAAARTAAAAAASSSSSSYESPTAQRRRSVSSTHLLVLSATIHLALLVYADHVDSHPERYGGLKYTDVDWRVVSDGARLIWSGSQGDSRAQGWLVRKLGWSVGDPYQRSTFRYTPLLPLSISPTLLHPLLGKSILALASLSIPPLLLSEPISSPFWPTHLIWTLNPFVLNITTRGSPEAFICLLVVLLVYALKRYQQQWELELGVELEEQRPTGEAAVQRGNGNGVGKNGGIGPHRSSGSGSGGSAKWLSTSAVVFAFAVGWKIYPIIYVPAIWTFLARIHRTWLARPIWKFGIVAAVTCGLLNLALWSVWGQPYLDHTYLYHLTRLDHRHNFSPYFYPIYLSLFPSPCTTPNNNSNNSETLRTLDLDLSSVQVVSNAVRAISRHPLTSFLPQLTLVLASGFALVPITNLEFAMFVQTVVFVVFNKVCTSQYFTWFLPLLPPLVPHLDLTRRKALLLVGAWVVAQALWLASAYRLELMARSVYLEVWMAALVLFAVSTWVVGELVGSWSDTVHGNGRARGRLEEREKVE